MNDLETKVLPIDAEEMSAEEAWTICYYRHMAEFVRAGVVFDQFKERLQDHRKQVRDQTTRATQEEEASLHNEMGPGGPPYAPPYVRRVRIYAHGTFCFTPRLIYPFFVTHPPCA